MVDGWIVLDKPAGLTSSQAVGRVRRLFGRGIKAGHAGTLDPLATGVLPIALGEATKTVPFVADGAKSYRFAVRFGEARTTDDTEGEVVETSTIRPSDAALLAALPGFIGRIEQRPPAFSAIKIGGRRAYDLARRGEAPELQSRPVDVHRLALLERPDPDHAVLEMDCGKGTYVRSLARDLGRALGTVAHVAWLRRTRSGPFGEGGAISLAKLEEFGHKSPPLEQLRPVLAALADIPALAVSGTDAALLRQGRPLKLPSDVPVPTTASTICATAEGKPVALVRFAGETLAPVRVFNL